MEQMQISGIFYLGGGWHLGGEGNARRAETLSKLLARKFFSSGLGTGVNFQIVSHLSLHKIFPSKKFFWVYFKWNSTALSRQGMVF